MRVQPWANVASLECVVVDDTGGLVVVFLGRRQVAGLELGRWLDAEGVVGNHRGYLAMLNPEIDLIVEDHDEVARPAKGERKRRWWRRGLNAPPRRPHGRSGDPSDNWTRCASAT